MKKACIASLVFVLAGVAAQGIDASRSTTLPDAIPKVVVTLTDTTIHFSQLKVKVTQVAFRIHNAGTVEHNFVIGSYESNTLKPGHTTRFLIGFPEVGKYLYLCTVNCKHAMRGDFVRLPGGHTPE